MRNFTLIKWGEAYSDSYTYGAVIRKEMNGVYYSAPMMPVAAKIRTWYSSGNYSEDRSSPALPLLRGGTDYNIELVVDENANNALQATIEFFDAIGHKIGMIYADDLQFSFTYPEEAVSYQISLLNKKHEFIKFHFIIIDGTPREEFIHAKILDNYSVIDYLEGEKSEHYVIDNFCRQTNMYLGSVADVHLLANPTEESFWGILDELFNALMTGERKIILNKGLYFDKLPVEFKVIPELIAIRFPETKISTNIFATSQISDKEELLMNLVKIWEEKNVINHVEAKEMDLISENDLSVKEKE